MSEFVKNVISGKKKKKKALLKFGDKLPHYPEVCRAIMEGLDPFPAGTNET